MVLQDGPSRAAAEIGYARVERPLSLGCADETPRVVLSALERVAISHRRISSGVEMERWRERGERSCVPLVAPLSWVDIVV